MQIGLLNNPVAVRRDYVACDRSYGKKRDRCDEEAT
jgi:hypothetical protein